jgi:hypothetical protein
MVNSQRINCGPTMSTGSVHRCRTLALHWILTCLPAKSSFYWGRGNALPYILGEAEHLGEAYSASIQTGSTWISGERLRPEDALLINLDEELPGTPQDPPGEILVDVEASLFFSSLLEDGRGSAAACEESPIAGVEPGLVATPPPPDPELQVCWWRWWVNHNLSNKFLLKTDRGDDGFISTGCSAPGRF